MAVEFEYKGEKWRRITHEPYEKFLVGVDPGFTVDPTAICVLHHQQIPLADDFKVDRDRHTTEQKVQERYDVVHLERLPLNTEYPEVVSHIERVLGRPPLRSAKPDLIVDATGIGISVSQLLERAGLRPIKVTITAGHDQTAVKHHEWHVGKGPLVASLDGLLHTGELKIAPALLEAPELREELTDFNRIVGAAGRATYQARVGAHDDLVLAVALCTWWAKQRRKGGRVLINGKTPAEMEEHIRLGRLRREAAATQSRQSSRERRHVSGGFHK